MVDTAPPAACATVDAGKVKVDHRHADELRQRVCHAASITGAVDARVKRPVYAGLDSERPEVVGHGGQKRLHAVARHECRTHETQRHTGRDGRCHLHRRTLSGQGRPAMPAPALELEDSAGTRAGDFSKRLQCDVRATHASRLKRVHAEAGRI